jgi:hypothetical protein
MYLDEVFSLIGLTEPIGLLHIVPGFLFDVAIAYFNLYVLIPRLLRRNKIGLYIFWTGLSLIAEVCYSLYQTILSCPECIEDIFYVIFDSLLINVGILGAAIAIKLLKINFIERKRLDEIKNQQLIVQLENLKQQINPHFLFNVLNNFYVMAQEKSDQLPDHILMLSDLMRHQTYHASKKKVPLYKEIEFIENYLNLEMSRREFLSVEIEKKNIPDELMIQPLLFLAFVENASKYSHGVSGDMESIRIKWNLDGEVLNFLVRNTVANNTSDRKKVMEGGFGLDNTRERLDLLYPGAYKLEIQEKEDYFQVDLSIHISIGERNQHSMHNSG